MSMKRRLKNVFVLFFAAVIMILGAATITHAAQVKIQGASSVSVGVGLKKQTNYVSNPAGAVLTYKVENASLASVNAEGVVTGLKEGKTRLIIHAGAYGSYTAKTGYVPLTVYRRTQTIRTDAGSYTVTIKGKTKIVAGSSSSRTYTSDNTSIARVDAKGNITGVAKGTTTITIRAKDTKRFKAATKKVKVEVKRISQVLEVNPTSLTMNPGNSNALSATAKTSISYTSSNSSVAAVDSQGTITAKAVGNAVITVKAKATSKYNSATAKVYVTVKAPVSEAYTKLKAAIETGNFNKVYTSDTRDDNGSNGTNPFMRRRMRGEGMQYTLGVIYSAADDQFQFSYAATGGNATEQVKMILTNPNTYFANPLVGYQDASGSFQGDALIYMATYTGKTLVNVNITSETGNAGNYTEQNRKAAAYSINKAFAEWNTFLKSALGIGFKDLGFIAYIG